MLGLDFNENMQCVYENAYPVMLSMVQGGRGKCKMLSERLCMTRRYTIRTAKLLAREGMLS